MYIFFIVVFLLYRLFYKIYTIKIITTKYRGEGEKLPPYITIT